MIIPFDTLLLFFLTTFVVVLSPGPAAIAVTAEAASNGFKRSLFVILGIAAANIVYFVLSATGIAALIVASSTLFSVIKWIGVAYLLYLGLSALLSRSGPLSIKPEEKQVGRHHRVFFRGFIIEFSNPKALLYFSALLPQFINIEQAIIPQLLILCAITFLLDIVCYSLYAYLGWKSMSVGLKPLAIKIINKSAGAMLIFAGLKMASVER
ncbi:LysE family translocator [Cocleimonas flava]|jgi:threonine/homoserine/homoserine lactone efflux protein|uniref:Threonine/homoserine/homoserine lactone efflux protein n=1 Tax=Cocleimonas flava TaxID=634765 RepID=A0A4V2P8C1_9GAMM|nr:MULTISPECIES: LysE family translocator [Cocleimonas]MEB8433504.1 LysE family translocator [Cocleimonas sp. KMM 6892]MEC4716315.1 LysE family translocator [Cocleimonas sp. KMM 6895]MEC4745792.1 LysE family translocator [Cocleimonas sp. KMM 6896]TCJ85145.1 threonine/homoserine/homoserine lactone efflux protein [Cocleimonas flava]